jgi:hypothetical protein
MSLGPFPFPDFNTPSRPPREPSRLWARVRARWKSNEPDETLSAGASPRANAEPVVRASEPRSELRRAA